MQDGKYHKIDFTIVTEKIKKNTTIILRFYKDFIFGW